MLPATISNNVPGTDLSLGADTALNAIVEVRQEKPYHFSSLRRQLATNQAFQDPKKSNWIVLLCVLTHFGLLNHQLKGLKNCEYTGAEHERPRCARDMHVKRNV